MDVSRGTGKTPPDPTRLGDVLTDLFRLRGFGQVRAQQQLAALWCEVAGAEIAARTRVCGIRQGVLQVGVENSALLQELESYHKSDLLDRLVSARGGPSIRDLRFRLNRRVA